MGKGRRREGKKVGEMVIYRLAPLMRDQLH